MSNYTKQQQFIDVYTEHSLRWLEVTPAASEDDELSLGSSCI